jgi:hypothetical protein
MEAALCLLLYPQDEGSTFPSQRHRSKDKNRSYRSGNLKYRISLLM